MYIVVVLIFMYIEESLRFFHYFRIKNIQKRNFLHILFLYVLEKQCNIFNTLYYHFFLMKAETEYN